MAAVVRDIGVKGLAIVVGGADCERQGFRDFGVVGVLLRVIDDSLTEEVRGIRQGLETRNSDAACCCSVGVKIGGGGTQTTEE